jgi:hypothetical protein
MVHHWAGLYLIINNKDMTDPLMHILSSYAGDPVCRAWCKHPIFCSGALNIQGILWSRHYFRRKGSHHGDDFLTTHPTERTKKKKHQFIIKL